MNLGQYFSSGDIAGIAPEIILTLTALTLLTIEMARVSRPGIILLVSALGLLLAGTIVVQGGTNDKILFGGMLHLNKFSMFYPFISIIIILCIIFI